MGISNSRHLRRVSQKKRSPGCAPSRGGVFASIEPLSHTSEETKMYIEPKSARLALRLSLSTLVVFKTPSSNTCRSDVHRGLQGEKDVSLRNQVMTATPALFVLPPAAVLHGPARQTAACRGYRRGPASHRPSAGGTRGGEDLTDGQSPASHPSP